MERRGGPARPDLAALPPYGGGWCGAGRPVTGGRTGRREGPAAGPSDRKAGTRAVCVSPWARRGMDVSAHPEWETMAGSEAVGGRSGSPVTCEASGVLLGRWLTGREQAAE